MTLNRQNNHEETEGLTLPDFKLIIFKIINIGRRTGNYYINVTDRINLHLYNQMIFQNKEVKAGKEESIFWEKKKTSNN